MRKAFIFILTLAIVAAGAFLVWGVWKLVTLPQIQAKFNRGYMWGVVARPSGLGRYHISTWTKILTKAKELNVKWLRITYDAATPNAMTENSQILKVAWESGMEVLLVVEPPSFDKLTNPYQEGYDQLTPITKQFKGKIKYYQVMNEVGSTMLKGGQYSGENESDYDMAKYEKAKNWIQGASKAINENDRSAKIIITDQWTHFAFLDMFKRDRVEFDYIGWNWFSDMGFLGDKTTTSGENVFEKLKSYGKPIILTEVNARPDSRKGQDENYQAEFIGKMAEFAYKNKAFIKGFFVHELLDIALSPKGQPEYYGIVKFRKSSTGANLPGDPKQAFFIYKEMIKQYK